MMNAKNFKKMNDCDLDIVVGGTGIFSKHNTYYDRSLGRRLSQSEVEDRLRQYVA